MFTCSLGGTALHRIHSDLSHGLLRCDGIRDANLEGHNAPRHAMMLIKLLAQIQRATTRNM